MPLLDRVHGRLVHTRRVRVLARHLAALLPANAMVLDVGCGDGAVGARLRALRGDVALEGIDVVVRPRTAIPVRPFDGRAIPYPDASVDAVLLVDVLHHADEPRGLLREAARVARDAVLVKDHCRDGVLAEPTLRFMDWAGNAGRGVAPARGYWTRAEWMATFDSVGLRVDRWAGALGLYPPPVSWVCERSLHFLARLAARDNE